MMLTVVGIGIVHDYSRWADDEAGLEALFLPVKDGPLHGWEITRDGVAQLKHFAGDKYKATYTYLILGHYALKDDLQSEKLFNIIVDAVIQKFIDNKIAGSEGHSLPTVTIKEWMFADVLCHRAELRLAVSEIWTKTPEADQDLLTIKLGQYLDPGTAWVMWKPATAYALDAIVVPPVPNGRKYKCTTAGISGAAAPVWPVVAGGVIADGTAAWTEDGAVMAQTSEITV